MQEVILHGNEFESKKEIHDYLKESLCFPGYYGNNLSALYDVMTDICDDTRITLDMRDVKDEEMEDYLMKIAEVMSDASENNMYLEFVCIDA